MSTYQGQDFPKKFIPGIAVNTCQNSIDLLLWGIFLTWDCLISPKSGLALAHQCPGQTYLVLSSYFNVSLSGQYISLCIPQGEIEGFDHHVVRNYSISCRPGEDFYRVSIKREASHDLLWPDGVVSTYFHERINVGSEINVSVLES